MSKSSTHSCHLLTMSRIDPVTNVDEQLNEEMNRGIQHLSLTRRLLGPSERTCYFHSVSKAHLSNSAHIDAYEAGAPTLCRKEHPTTSTSPAESAISPRVCILFDFDVPSNV